MIAAIAAGGEDALRANPVTSCITCSFTPLEFKYMDTHVIMQAGKYGVPLHACSLPSSGGTAPLSVASMAVMAAAEIVGMTVMAHILAPGTPVIATPLMFTLDMRTGSALQSCVESLQAANMAIQLMKRGWGMLAHTYGSGSDTPDVDVASRKSNRLPLPVVWYWVLKRPARVFSCARSLRSDVSRTSEAALDISSTCTAATMIEVLRSLGRKCFNHKEMQSIHQIRAGNRSGEYWPGENASAPPCAEASCSIPDDHISPRRSALFMARSVLRDIRDGVRPC